MEHNFMISDANVKVKTGIIKFTEYEKLKNQALEIAEFVRNAEVNENNIQQNKKMLATLNHAVYDLDARRIAIKKMILEPYDLFAEQVAEIIGIVKDADSIVRQQVRSLEEDERDQKLMEIKAIFNARFQHYDFGFLFGFEDFIQPQYLNKSVSMKKVEDEMIAWLEQKKIDIDVIKTMPDSDEILAEFKISQNFASAIRIVQTRKAEKEKINQILNSTDEFEVSEKIYLFIVRSEKDAKLTEMLLKENKINYTKEIK